MIIYISGPMTGLPEYNHPLFNKIAAKLRGKGYTVLNPAEIVLKDIPKDYKPKDKADAERVWRAYMRECIKMLMDADQIVTLPHWHDSKGANIEVFWGEEIGIDAISVGEFMQLEKLA